MANEEVNPFDYDGIWKDFIETFWREILERFLPQLYKKTDLEKEPEFLDKELRDLTASLEPEENQEKKSKRFVDKLIKIFLKDGGEEWVLLHIEIQGRGGGKFSLRMFRYQCLIFIHHDRHPAALAILTAKRPKKEGDPGIYEHKFFGTEINYKYNVVKAYDFTDEELTASESYVDLFMYALKKAKKHRKSDSEKFTYMREILRLLVQKNFDKKMRRVFMIFVENAMHLRDKKFRALFRKEADETFSEGEDKMKYKTVTEEIYEEGEEKGRMEGRKEERSNLLSKFIKSGLLSDEQIAQIVEQTPEEIASLRSELATA